MSAGQASPGRLGIRLSRGSVPLGGPQFMAIGTAIRAPGALHLGPVRAGFRQADHGGLGPGGQICSGTAAP
jgi:hypothetical protein